MRIAILIAGYIRSFETNINYLKKNLFQNNNIDIYIHKSKNEKNDKYKNNINWENIKKNINPKVIIETTDICFNNNNKINNILNQFYKFFILNNLKNTIAISENISYDLVVKWRPDILLNNKISFNNIQKILFIYQKIQK